MIEFFLTAGFLLLCAGTLLGIPHGHAKRRGDQKSTELWRVAHLSTCVGAVSVIGMSLALERLLGRHALYTLALFTLAAYCFFVACSLSGYLNAAWDGDRTQPRVQVVYRLQLLASILSLAAVAVALLSLLMARLS